MTGRRGPAFPSWDPDDGLLSRPGPGGRSVSSPRKRHGWDSSNRRAELPPDWPSRRAACLKRDPVCTCPGCHRCTRRPGQVRACSAPSTDADHLGDPMDHDDLGGKCHPCHQVKTQGESLAARRRPKTRPAERHPGWIGEPPA